MIQTFSLLASGFSFLHYGKLQIMSVTRTLQAAGALARPLVARDLRGISGLRQIDKREFLEAWASLPPARRAVMAGEMAELAEEHVELDLSEMWNWLLEDKDATVRVHAIEGLWEDDSVRAMRRLLAIMRDDDSVEARSAAAVGLAQFAYRASLDELDEGGETLEKVLSQVALNEREPLDVRRRALESAGYFAENEAVQREIERAYRSDEQLLRESALVAMGHSLLPRWLPLIVDGMESKSPALRYEASRAAGEMGEDAQPLLPKLAPLLTDRDLEVALSAIWALGQIGGPQAERVLQQITKSEDEARKQAATEALEELKVGQGLF